ncbi:tetratricopeptide repeat protein [Gallaecimonas mangrovi]|uniref:tetratricopeptide repeat protein n=1 Tax=Gallaecimonas mangrovi TaxID=2291597 RepID=UPI0012602CF6|nr:tetratricopeptide repeat protein [Gallaecimonas mangrovi]
MKPCNLFTSLALVSLLALSGCATHVPTAADKQVPITASNYQQALADYQFSQARQLLEQAATQGSDDAKAYLATHQQWLDAQCALEKASPQAQATKAQQLLKPHGSGVPDYSQAAFWAKRAADANNAMGQFVIGYLHELGLGTRLDIKLAVSYYHKAAKQGLLAAQRRLALLMERGHETALNLPQAAYWYTQAAKQGDAQSQFDLAQLYRLGKGVKKDLTAAQSWYQKAASQGYAKAQFELAMLLPASGTKAHYWVLKAAKQGDVQAIDWLSLHHS